VRKAGGAPIAALVAMVLIWGYSWVVMKLALRHAHPFDFAALRVAIGFTLLFAIVKLRGRSCGCRPTAWRS
jgi:drug/metabolite transporter (DMT)-like permease